MAAGGGGEAVFRHSRRPALYDLREVWHARELLYFLVWRDIKVRYKQTVLGAAWAVLQPLLTMAAFAVFFGRLAGVPSDGIPYPIFAYAGLLPWQLCAHAVTDSGQSLVANQGLITKVYFPRLVIPLATVLAGLVDFGVAVLALVALMAWYGIGLGPALLALPLFVLLALATSLGVGLWLSALNVQYRDVRYTLPFLVQFWLLLTPIAYPASLVPEAWRAVYALNPMVAVVEGFRASLFGTRAALAPLLLPSLLVTLALLVTGIAYFRRMERSFADVV